MGRSRLDPGIIEKIKSTHDKIKQDNPADSPWVLAKKVAELLYHDGIKCSSYSVMRYAMPEHVSPSHRDRLNGGRAKKRRPSSSDPERFVLATSLTQVVISGDQDNFRFEIIGASPRDVADTFREWASTRFVKVSG